MKLEDLKIGKMYWFKNRTKSCYKIGSYDCVMLFAGTPFIVLGLKEHTPILEVPSPTSKPWYQLKILGNDGDIWYTDIREDVFEYIELIPTHEIHKG